MTQKRTRRVTITVTDRELNGLEDFLVCIPLCDKHKELGDYKDGELESMWCKCPDCEKVYHKWRRPAWRVMSKLWKAYDK